jgi:hypothetical protein
MTAKELEPVQIRLRIGIGGLVEDVPSPRRGDILTVPTLAAARRYVKKGYAQFDLTGPLGAPYEPSCERR